jgi:hypothetical protein
MKKHEFKVGDLVRVNSSYVGVVAARRADILANPGPRRARLEVCKDDVGIVLDTKFYSRWPQIVSVYWSVRQREGKIRTEYLESINEQLRV